ALVIDDTSAQHIGLFNLDVLVQRQHGSRLPAKQRRQQASLWDIQQYFHVYPFRRRRLPLQRVHVNITGGKISSRVLGKVFGHSHSFSLYSTAQSHQAVMVFVSVPICCTVADTTSPTDRHEGGVIANPTPFGVPVAITSPGSSVMPE